MINLKNSVVKIGILLIALVSLTGCVVAAVTGAALAGGASVAYITGTLKADIQAHPVKIAEATKRAFAVYSIDVQTFKANDLEAEVAGETATGKKIEILIKRKSDLISELLIKVGTFGDEAFSNLLYDEIKRQLIQDAGSTSTVTTYSAPPTATTYSEPTLAPAGN